MNDEKKQKLSAQVILQPADGKTTDSGGRDHFGKHGANYAFRRRSEKSAEIILRIRVSMSAKAMPIVFRSPAMRNFSKNRLIRKSQKMKKKSLKPKDKNKTKRANCRRQIARKDKQDRRNSYFYRTARLRSGKFLIIETAH